MKHDPGVLIASCLLAGLCACSDASTNQDSALDLSRDVGMSHHDSDLAAEAGSFVETPGEVKAVAQERATPEQIGPYIPLSAALKTHTTSKVRYRPVNGSSWRDAHPLAQIRPEWTSSGAPVKPVDALAGSIFAGRPVPTWGAA